MYNEMMIMCYVIIVHKSSDIPAHNLKEKIVSIFTLRTVVIGWRKSKYILKYSVPNKLTH
jgi:hypothetical protein